MEPFEEEHLPTSRRGEPRRAELEAPLERGAARGAKPPSFAASAAAPSRSKRARRYTPEEKRALVAEYAAASAQGESMVDFCARRGVSTPSLCTWRKRLHLEGDAGLASRPNPRNAAGPRRGPQSYTPEQRRSAVEAFLGAGQTITDFARVVGVSREVLSRWIKHYREAGPKALERGVSRARRARSPGPDATSTAGIGRRLAQPVRDLITRTRRRFPVFGLKKVRQFLLRFYAVKVSTGGIKSTLEAAGLPSTAAIGRKRHRAPPAVRRFERAAPMELWQTDITSFLFGRHRERAYLTVFLDDASRYVVSFALHLQQKSELVLEALKDGMARFGKPKEILSDQGRQYFSWRGKSEFQKLLHREGIKHVVARSHHPQTVGKCERLWETIQVEFLERIVLQDLADARRRLAHYFAHYNFFRPHQGIDGLVPADRFFEVQDALRQALEAQLEKNALALALNEAPPPPVFLFGQIGDEQVVMHGERGKVVIQTARGEAREILAEQLELRGGLEQDAVAAAPARTDDGEGMAPIDSKARAAQVAIAAEHARGQAASSGRDERDGHDVDRASDRGSGSAEVEHAGRDVERGDRDRGDGGRAGGSDCPAHADEPQAPPRGGAEDAAAGAGALGGGESGGAAAGASSGERALAGVAREDAAERGGGAARALAAAGVATEPAGGRGDGGRALEAAAAAREGRTLDGLGRGSGGRGSQAPEEGSGGTAAQAQARGGCDRALAGISGAADASARAGRSARDAGEVEGGGDGRGGEAEHPGACEETLRDAQTDCAGQHDSESGAG